MGIDTSGEPKEGSDPMAIVAGAYNKGKENFFTQEVWSDQATPEELDERAHEIYWRHYRSKRIKANVFLEQIVSASGLGRSLFRNVAEKKQLEEPDRKEFWEPIPVMEIAPSINKDVRLLAMRLDTEQRKMHYIPGHSQQNLLVDQWCNWIPGTNTHKKTTDIRWKIDVSDAHTLLHQNITKEIIVPEAAPMVRVFAPRR